MNITEMHVWFRQYAQQMGMQNVRAILPEQIDVLINTSISDIVNQLVRTNIGLTEEKQFTDSNKLNQIASLGDLYKVSEFGLVGDGAVLRFSPTFANLGKMVNNIDQSLPDYLFLVDFAINYRPCTVGYNEPTFSETSEITKWFPVRIIDNSVLADTMNDAVLKNKITSPILVIYDNNTIELYIDRFKYEESTNSYSLMNKLLPYQLRMSYVVKPAKVKYGTDVGEANVDCDLPEHLHIDILKHAVELYQRSTNDSSGGGYGYAPQYQQAQQPAAQTPNRNYQQ